MAAGRGGEGPWGLGGWVAVILEAPSQAVRESQTRDAGGVACPGSWEEREATGGVALLLRHWFLLIYLIGLHHILLVSEFLQPSSVAGQGLGF